MPGARPRSPSALALPQVVRPDPAAIQLARGHSREPRYHGQDPGDLESGQALTALPQQFLSEPGGPGAAVPQFDQRDDTLSPFVVRNADHDGVRDRLVLQQFCLDLSRVNVHPARDDQVGTAVAQVYPAIVVQVADVARDEVPGLM